ncbi:MAG: hypothetical protein ACOX2M_01630 [Fastidiosipilaceae bacterium]|jgi:hypothetical protein
MKKLVTLSLAILMSMSLTSCQSTKNDLSESVQHQKEEVNQELESAVSELERIGQSLQSDSATRKEQDKNNSIKTGTR